MELFILLVVVVAVVGWWIIKEGKSEQAGNHPLESFTKKLDVNKDGKVDAQDAVAVANEVKTVVVNVADVNKDGKVDTQDAVAVVEKTTKAVKKTQAKAKEAVNKVKTSRKSKAK